MTTKTVLYSVLGVGAATFLSICDLCKTSAQAATTPGAVHSAAQGSVPAMRIPLAVTAQALGVEQAQSPRTVTLAVHGMTCGGCVLGTRTVLTRLKGVTRADVSYENGTAVVTYDPAKVTVAQMIAAIHTLRYTATLVAPAPPKAG